MAKCYLVMGLMLDLSRCSILSVKMHAICTLINSWGKEVITTLRKRFAEAQCLCSKRMFAQHKVIREKKRKTSQHISLSGNKCRKLFFPLQQNLPADVLVAKLMVPLGLSHLLQPAWVCTVAPCWLMSGQGEQKSIPRLQCGLGDGWPLRGLCRADGSRAQESQKLRHGTCCRARRMATQRKDARVRGKSKKWILYCEYNSAFFFHLWKSYTSFFPLRPLVNSF